MRKGIKIIFILLMSVLGIAAALFVAGFVHGFLTAWKHNTEMIAARTFFGLTLEQKFYAGHERDINYNDKSWRALNRDFNLTEIANEFSLVSSPVKLSKPFFGIEFASALLSSHSNRILGIAICKSFDEANEDYAVENFGEAEVLCEKIRKVLEEKHSCQMIPFSQEPSFVKKFVRTPSPTFDRSFKLLEANIKSESGVYVSPRSCFVVTPEFFASIFVIGFREINTYPDLMRIANPSSSVAEPAERRWYRNKDYVILLIHSPSLDVKKERELVELDYKIREESRKRKEEEMRIREHKEALEAM